MKVYVVTSGSYSDYGIDAVFTTEEDAWKYASLSSYRRIEEYETDCEKIEGTGNPYILITYDFKNNEINEMDLVETETSEKIHVCSVPYMFEFSVPNTLRNYKAYSRYKAGGKHSALLKAAQDTFAMFMERNNKTREELIRNSKKACERYKERMAEKRKNYPFFFATTSMPVLDPVDEKLTAFVANYYITHNRYPDVSEINNEKEKIMQEKEK